MSTEFSNKQEISSLPVFLPKKEKNLLFWASRSRGICYVYTVSQRLCKRHRDLSASSAERPGCPGPNRLLSMEIKFLIYSSTLWAAHSSSSLTCSNKWLSLSRFHEKWWNSGQLCKVWCWARWPKNVRKAREFFFWTIEFCDRSSHNVKMYLFCGLLWLNIYFFSIYV